MRVLILGANGYIGQHLVQRMLNSAIATPVIASRRPAPANSGNTIARVQVDTLNREALQAALAGIDGVVNCVAGSADAIAEGARLLTEAAAAQTKPPQIVHMSSMAVYGAQEGTVDEQAALDPSLGWYARAKVEAEAHMQRHAEAGHAVVMLRPGCVYGPGSELWVGRIGRLLQSGRLGDLGEAGDGWSNLIHVTDVCEAVLKALQLPITANTAPVFNLAAGDSPRWNQYFTDLALAIGATPLRRVSARRVQLDAKFAGPVLKMAERLLQKAGVAHQHLPVPISPSLLKLWPQQIRLDNSRMFEELDLRSTRYRTGVNAAAAWFNTTRAAALKFRG